MSKEISPEKAAQIAEQSEITEGMAEIPEGAQTHMEAEGIDAAPSRSSQLIESLWNTNPNPPLETVESPWNPEKGGMPRIYRGIQKLADVDGLPAVVDIMVGLAEFWVQHKPESGDGGSVETMESGDLEPVDGVEE